MTDKDLYDIYLRAYNMHPKHSGGSKHGAGLRAVADAARTPAPEANARWTPTHQNGSVVCAPPPCWLLIDDVLNPERDPWMTYWDGSGSPINCTSYRIIGYYETPPPPKDASGVRPQNTHEGDKP